MSFFVLADNSLAGARLQRFCASAEEAGFAGPRQIALANARLVVFGDQSGTVPAWLDTGNGDFVVVLGSLIYKGATTPACLPRLLADFDLDTFSWKGLIGTHTVLIHKDNRLHVFGDGLGASKVYSASNQTVWSNSFLAMCELAEPGLFDPQACYEYVCNGSVFGRRTLLRDVASLPANTVLVIGERIEEIRRPTPITDQSWQKDTPLDRIADQHCRQLDTVFEPIASNFGDRLRVSFSGGFDSRLMLAMLLRHGARPELFVYGDEQDEDVQIARTISRAEGLALIHIDKASASTIEPDAFADTVHRDLFAFDGWKVEHGLFDFGIDREDRLSRHRDGHIPLNGSLGEIYRNFLYMPDHGASTAAVVSTFYSQYDPRAFTRRFDQARYRASLQSAMREAIDAGDDAISRSQVEQLYPNFRGRFWTGRDAQINQRFGPMFFPYLEHAAICNTASIPIRHKDLGYLQGRMIGRINARLAAYPSDYGFALDGPRPLKYRLKTRLGTHRPPWLRGLSFRLRHRSREPRDGALAARYLDRVIDLDFPVMRELFHVDRVFSAQQYGLLATLEYLARRYDLQVPPE